MRAHTVWELARLADVADPDNEHSLGARFLRGIETALAEAQEHGDLHEDDLCQLADDAVPVYTHERWVTFVDLAAYAVDTSELGPVADLTEAAGIALYLVAERLIAALLEGQ